MREDDPCQEHPELGISCSRLFLQTKASTVATELKEHRQKKREKGEKSGKTRSNKLENVV